jgi:RNA recognition motif-containing protein
VDFATYDDMKAALEKLDGEDWNGNRIRLVEVSFSVIII